MSDLAQLIHSQILGESDFQDTCGNARRREEGELATRRPGPGLAQWARPPLLTYPTRLCRCPKGRSKELRHSPAPHSAFFIGPERSRLGTSHACDPRVWARGVSCREGGDKMAASVGQGCLRWLPGPAWRSRYNCLGILPSGEGRPEPSRGLERGVVSLSRARPQRQAGGDGATPPHLELGRRCGCLRLGRSESGLNLSLSFHSTRDKKTKIETKAPSTPGEKGCVSATRAEAGLDAFSGVVLLGRAPRWEEHWSGSWAAFTLDSWTLK